MMLGPRKNCLEWSRDYLKQRLKGLKASTSTIQVQTTQVLVVEGDVDLNQRKGKVLTIFDLKLEITWEGENTTDSSSTSGRILIPEFTHDTAKDEFVFDITVEKDSKQADAIKAQVKKELTEKIKTVLLEFPHVLIDTHSKDVHIPLPELKKPTHAAAASFSNATKPSALNSNKEAGKTAKFSTVTIHDSVELMASPQDVFTCLTDAHRASMWARSPVQTSAEANASLKFYGGNLQGTVVETAAFTKIVWKLRSGTWPADHYSTVTFTLEQGRESTTIRLTQAGVPFPEEETTKQNWTKFFWTPIKAIYGYGAAF